MVALKDRQDFVLCGHGIGDIPVAEYVLKRRMTLKLPKLDLKISSSRKADLGRHWQPPPPQVDPLALRISGISTQAASNKVHTVIAPNPSPRNSSPTRHDRNLPPLGEVFSPNILLFDPTAIPLARTATPHSQALHLVGTSAEMSHDTEVGYPPPPWNSRPNSLGGTTTRMVSNVGSTPRLPTPLPSLAKVAPVLDVDAVMVRQAADLRPKSSASDRLPTGLGLSVIDKDTLRREILGNSFKARKDYNSSMEKNWLRQHKDECRQKRQQKRVDAFLKANTSIAKGFDRAFDIGDEDDDVGGTDFNSEEYARCDSVLANYSECDSDHSDIDILMINGELQTHEVRRKSARQRLRREQKFEALLVGNGYGSEDEAEIQRMSDVDIRALRLRLQTKEEGGGWPVFSQTAEQLMAEIRKLVEYSTKLPPKKKSNRRRRKKRYVDDDDDVGRGTSAVRQRFMSEYGSLFHIDTVSGLINANLMNAEQKETNGHRESATRCALDDFRKIVIDGIVIPSTTARDGKLELHHEMNKLYNEDNLAGKPSLPRHQSARRRSHAGELLDIPKHLKQCHSIITSGNGRRKSRRSRKSKRTTSEVSQASGKTEAAHGSPEGFRESVGDDEVLRPASPEVLEPQDIAQEFRETFRRPTSARRPSADSNRGHDLHTLLAGIDFPAKDIKIQIAERKIRKRRQKALEAARRAAEEAQRDDLDQGLTDEELDVCPEELPDDPRPFILPKYMRRPSELDIFKPLLRENPLQRLLEPAVKDHMDTGVIPYMTELFNEMRNCRYIRWNQRDQKIIQRMLELEILAMD